MFNYQIDKTSKKIGFVVGVDREYIEPIEGAHLLSYLNIENEKVRKKHIRFSLR